MQLNSLFDLRGKCAVVTGGGGGLGSALARGLSQAGAKVVVTGVSEGRASAAAEALRETGGEAMAVSMDVFNHSSIVNACQQINEAYGAIDILVNCVGGNVAEATTSDERRFFDLPESELRKVVDLNLIGGVIAPCQVFGEAMSKQEDGGAIINISSMAAQLPLTRVVGYSAAKGAVDNFTKWLAVHFAQEYSPKLRVNAVAPGFFLTDQNRFLLTTEDGGLTDRGNKIVSQTPMGSFGEPEDLIGAVVWLASPSARFVTGIIVPVDGGFSAYSGV